MYNYLINFRQVLLGAPLQLGALSARLVRLWECGTDPRSKGRIVFSSVRLYVCLFVNTISYMAV